MKADQTLDLLMKQKSLHIEVAQLIKGLREQKGLTQAEVSGEAKISRQYLSELENGRRVQLNMTTLAAIVNACGEQLFVTSSFKHPLQVSDQTVKEDRVLKAYSQGRWEEAEKQLAEIRQWSYPSKYLIAKCKRNLGIAISYYFRGLRNQSQVVMTRLIHGLNSLDSEEEAERFLAMYYRVISQGEAAMRTNNQGEAKGANTR